MAGKRKRREDGYEKNENLEESEVKKETLGNKLVMVFVTLFIIFIWLGIIALLIKTDFGGFGSSVLSPVLKDVPVLNKILPNGDNYVDITESTEETYDSLDEAIEQIKNLERQLDSANVELAENKDTISGLQGQIDELSKYKEEQAAFEAEKEKFYEEVVFSDEAPDISEYKDFYESIEPENAEVLYKQVVEQLAYDEELEEYVKMYSSMKAKNAAAIFDTMTDNLGLVADILLNMDSQYSADILAEMDPATAAKLTEIMEPTN